jgi:hypothetical protein
MLRRRQINADPKGAARRFASGAADAARWPFERAAWAVERRLVWPLRERTAGLRPPRHAAGAAALGAVAIAAVAAGLLLSGGGGKGETERVAAPARVAVAPPSSKPAAGKPQGPTLQGVPPSFGAGKGAGASKQDGAAAAAKDEAAADSTAPEAGEVEGGTGAAASAGSNGSAGEGAAATASKAKAAPAGPEAMKVARRFSEAFVFYEIGEHPARAKTVFGATATPELAEALAERPPRLPANAKVPKAKVVNLVPGPRRGRDYTVSVSLLRVGLTSELRITLRHDKSEGWRVSEILG